jgi:hypothetical protein
MLNVASPRIRPGEVADQLLEGRRGLKGILVQNVEAALSMWFETC